MMVLDVTFEGYFLNHNLLRLFLLLRHLFFFFSLFRYYVGCIYANLACAQRNHALMVEEGALQPIVTLAYSSDSDIHQQAAAALRGLSW